MKEGEDAEDAEDGMGWDGRCRSRSRGIGEDLWLTGTVGLWLDQGPRISRTFSIARQSLWGDTTTWFHMITPMGHARPNQSTLSPGKVYESGVHQ
jgi:hypothetical protein